MVKLFLPHAEEDETLRSYRAVRESVQQLVGHDLDPRRIFRLVYRHDGHQHVAEVGQPESGVGEEVIAIFKQANYHLYFVCTANRGIIRNRPILVGSHDVDDYEDFEPE